MYQQYADRPELIDGTVANKRDNENHWKRLVQWSKSNWVWLKRRGKKLNNSFHYDLNSPTMIPHMTFRWTKRRNKHDIYSYKKGWKSDYLHSKDSWTGLD